MNTIRYITISEFSEYHDVDPDLVIAFIREGLVRIREQDNTPCIEEEDIEPLEAMIRLHNDLNINLPGLETIMYMRERIANLQNQVREMEYRLHRYEQLFDKFF